MYLLCTHTPLLYCSIHVCKCITYAKLYYYTVTYLCTRMPLLCCSIHRKTCHLGSVQHPCYGYGGRLSERQNAGDCYEGRGDSDPETLCSSMDELLREVGGGWGIPFRRQLQLCSTRLAGMSRHIPLLFRPRRKSVLLSLQWYFGGRFSILPMNKDEL